MRHVLQAAFLLAVVSSGEASAGTKISFEVGPTSTSEGAPPDLDLTIVGSPSEVGGDAWRIVVVPEGGTPPYEFALEPTPPDGMLFDADDGTLEGGSLPPGTSEFVLAVRDGNGAVAAADLSVVATEDGPPTVSSMGWSR